jgi:hypothetical protein
VTFENVLQEVQKWPLDERKRLISAVVDTLTIPLDLPAVEDDREYTLLDLEGLGKEIWEGIDAQQYVDALRSEWDRQISKVGEIIVIQVENLEL